MWLCFITDPKAIPNVSLLMTLDKMTQTDWIEPSSETSFWLRCMNVRHVRCQFIIEREREIRTHTQKEWRYYLTLCVPNNERLIQFEGGSIEHENRGENWTPTEKGCQNIYIHRFREGWFSLPVFRGMEKDTLSNTTDYCACLEWNTSCTLHP